MTAKPGQSVRGSNTGRPIMVLFDVLGQRWTLRVLWELRTKRLTFRELQAQCENVSPTVLNTRLKSLRELDLVDHDTDGYGHTSLGHELATQLATLDGWSQKWAKSLELQDPED